MRWKEKLYERRLKRPIDEKARAAINSEFHRRRDQISVAAELCWSGAKPELIIRSQWISFIVHFTQERMVVDAELSLTAKMFVTDQHRRDAIDLIHNVADDLDL
jgi:hypothetical protein